MSCESARLHGRVALVTGAAGGLGASFALRLAQEGADVVLVDVRPCDEVAERLAALEVRTLAATADVSDEQAVAELAARVTSRFGRCDILVNNAGFGRVERFEEITLQSWRELMAVNLEGPFLMSRALVGEMRARGWGRIVNIASNTFGMGLPIGFTHYIASKGGVIGLTRALASEFGAHGITVNAISPGLTRTPSTTRKMSEQFERDRVKQAIPRTGEPEDLVGMLAYLVSDDASFVTGQTFNVDGGLVRG
ncbi:SDR family NAD(P)-dependent oxidoreductase [Conexibacter sp. CPCC 206217]|uniref:SDR family NAD(P)-dependent oxidoreductase n=1 Tax=Conexibacter sp. CPCC 206217 TaxID=3064574 RepID=UPI0027284F48|nr:3-oxoacyl-ACP reductase family protein [Conexibacter sp. CPCC 206217]MDO8212066.1 3-oxoacyl-ACP reductase family protein [Conexibacter sp. CPCC 206217]